MKRIAAAVEKAVLSAIDRQAAMLTPHIDRALKQAGERAVKALEMNRNPADAAVSGMRAQLEAVVTPRIAAAAEVGADQTKLTVDTLEAKDAENFTAARYTWAQTAAAKRVKGVSETTRELIRRKVERAARNNTPPRQLAEDINEALSGKISKARAARIARTELHNAATFGQLHEAQMQGRRFGKRFVKVWRSTRDHRTRMHHRLADGQTRPIDEPFTVMNEQVMRPGDGSAANAINCRCVLTIVPEKTAELSGKPVLKRTKTGVRARLGQAEVDAAPSGKLLQIERGGHLPDRAAGKLYATLAQESAQQGRALAAPQSMSAGERAAFEALGKRRSLRLIKDVDLPTGALSGHPRPPMILQLISEVDDQLLYRDLIVMLTQNLEPVPQ